MGRFVSPDTVTDGEQYDDNGRVIDSSTQGWNRYMYCHGNPVLYKDPSGHNGISQLGIELQQSGLGKAIPCIALLGIAIETLPKLIDAQKETLDDVRESVDKALEIAKNSKIVQSTVIGATTATGIIDSYASSNAKDDADVTDKVIDIPRAKPKRKNKKNIPLFRAVMPDEYKQIKATGTFQNKWLERKYFSLTPQGAKKYAKMAEEKFGDEPYMLMGTSIPADKITPDMLVNVDGGIDTVTVPTNKLKYLTSPIDLGKANE